MFLAGIQSDYEKLSGSIACMTKRLLLFKIRICFGFRYSNLGFGLVMQTKHEVESLLASAGVGPNKRLGQNFLIDLNLMRFLIDAAEITRDDVVIEIGCGTGSFTEGLADKAGKVIVVEYDKVLAGIASNQFAKKDYNNIHLINSDALQNKNTLCAPLIKALDETIDVFTGDLKLVANLPYNIATPLMVNLTEIEVGSRKKVVDSMFVTVQKEVGDRMAAPAGDKHYGPLSIIMAATGDIKVLKNLGTEVFWPRPAVHSAMVRYIRDEMKVAQIKDIDLLKQTVNLFMGHRRKMLKACTKFAVGRLKEVADWPEVFEQCNVDPTNRAEKITVDQFIAVANACG